VSCNYVGRGRAKSVFAGGGTQWAISGLVGGDGQVNWVTDVSWLVTASSWRPRADAADRDVT